VKIAIVGATGFVGAKILAEALLRNHDVVAITRSPEKLPRHIRVRPVKADVNDVSVVRDFETGGGLI
jgi:putative NADH-flavin reductase